MRLLRFGLGSLLTALLVYLYLALIHPKQVAREHPFFDGRNPLAMAHQGGGGIRPENTLVAFRESLALGVDVLEMDLRATSDGRIVVVHDPTVDRTTDGRGRVSELSLDEIQRLDAGFRFEDERGALPYRGQGIRIPTFEEVLVEFPEARLNVEMKSFSGELARSLCRTILELADESRLLVASFEHEPMSAFREACPGVATSATMREALFFFQLHRIYLGSLFRSPSLALQVPEKFGDLRVVEPRFLGWARARNLGVHVWTVNERADMRRLRDMGVAGILTDYPDRLLEVLGRKKRTAAR